MRVGYFGPPGTFTEDALLASAPADVEPVALATIHATIAALADGSVERAVVPIENALEGSVDTTLDALTVDFDDVVIVDEVVRPIVHCLIAAAPVALSEIELVTSHPQALGQCAGYLRRELPQARVQAAAGSTAGAVRTIAEPGHERWAAIGTALAARLYGATVLRENIADRPGNETRFVWLARRGEEPEIAAERWKTSVVFWGGGHDTTPGWLVGCLSELATRDINLTRIESRPQRIGLGQYLFYVDLEGTPRTPVVAEALQALESHCEGLRTLGTYPVARR